MAVVILMLYTYNISVRDIKNVNVTDIFWNALKFSAFFSSLLGIVLNSA